MAQRASGESQCVLLVWSGEEPLSQSVLSELLASSSELRVRLVPLRTEQAQAAEQHVDTVLARVAGAGSSSREQQRSRLEILRQDCTQWEAQRDQIFAGVRAVVWCAHSVPASAQPDWLSVNRALLQLLSCLAGSVGSGQVDYRNHVRQFVLVSRAGVLNPWHPLSLWRNATSGLELEWRLRMENALAISGLPYLILRLDGPVRLLSSGQQGLQFSQTNSADTSSVPLSSGDLAQAIRCALFSERLAQRACRAQVRAAPQSSNSRDFAVEFGELKADPPLRLGGGAASHIDTLDVSKSPSPRVLRASHQVSMGVGAATSALVAAALGVAAVAARRR